MIKKYKPVIILCGLMLVFVLMVSIIFSILLHSNTEDSTQQQADVTEEDTTEDSIYTGESAQIGNADVSWDDDFARNSVPMILSGSSQNPEVAANIGTANMMRTTDEFKSVVDAHPELNTNINFIDYISTDDTETFTYQYTHSDIVFTVTHNLEDDSIETTEPVNAFTGDRPLVFFGDKEPDDKAAFYASTYLTMNVVYYAKYKESKHKWYFYDNADRKHLLATYNTQTYKCTLYE